MKRTFSLIAAVALVLSMLALSASAAETNLIDNSKWAVVNDADGQLLGWTFNADGTSALTTDVANWAHAKQTITVEPSTAYVFSLTVNLTGGVMRLDVHKADGSVEEIGLVVANVGGAYGQDTTFNIDITTEANQTEFVVDLRNSGPGGEQAVGQIKSVSFAKKGSDSSDNAGTSDITAVVIVAAAVAAASAIFVAGKRH